MLDNFFNKINQEVDKRAEEREKAETPPPTAPPRTETIELKPEDLVPVVEPSEKALTMPVIPSEHVTELVNEQKDVHGPLEAGAETLSHQEAQTLKTDASIALEKQGKMEQTPTVRDPESIELKATEAQTFKTGETIAREDAAKEAAEGQYQAGVAQEKMTLRKMAEGYMEYDAIHNRVTEWLKTLDEMLATPQPLEELIKLKADALKAKEKIESQLNLEQYGIAKSEPGATPFTVEVPAEWPQIEARLNEIKESLNAGHALETAVIPTVRMQGPEATA